MKIELNDGYDEATLKVYSQDDPEEVVENFAIKHNLSENAKNRLLDNVLTQLNHNESMISKGYGP